VTKLALSPFIEPQPRRRAWRWCCDDDGEGQEQCEVLQIQYALGAPYHIVRENVAVDFHWLRVCTRAGEVDFRCLRKSIRRELPFRHPGIDHNDYIQYVQPEQYHPHANVRSTPPPPLSMPNRTYAHEMVSP